MTVGLLFFWFVAPSLFRTAHCDELDSLILRWTKFNEGTQSEYLDDISSIVDRSFEEPLEIGDRSLQDYDTRESPPFEKVCEVQFQSVIHLRDRDVTYEYRHYPTHNATCVPSDVANPLDYSRHNQQKDFCIIKHQKLADNQHLCQTVFRKIPVLKRKKGTNCWTHEIQKFGVGCKCHIAVKFD